MPIRHACRHAYFSRCHAIYAAARLLRLPLIIAAAAGHFATAADAAAPLRAAEAMP